LIHNLQGAAISPARAFGNLAQQPTATYWDQWYHPQTVKNAGLSGIVVKPLLVPGWRNSARLLPWLAYSCSFLSDKGLDPIVGGFTPSPFGAVTVYTPTWPEATIVAGVWAVGALMITAFYKITLSLREAN